ncbi:uncharacterized protein LOC144743487 [Ciona intestinalis]
MEKYGGEASGGEPIAEENSTKETTMPIDDRNVTLRRPHKRSGLYEAREYVKRCADDVDEATLVSEDMDYIKGTVGAMYEAKRRYKTEVQISLQEHEDAQTRAMAAEIDELVAQASNNARSILTQIRQESREDSVSSTVPIADKVTYNLPPVKIETFSGSVIKFPSWETAFDSLIGSRASSAAQKLNMLQQYLSGEPRHLVDGFFLLQSEEAYTEARKQLKARYGNNSVISKSFTDKLYTWPKIGANDSSGLRCFSDFLTQVGVAKRTIGDLKILDFANESAKILSRLPQFIVGKWRDVVLDYKSEHSGNYPPFEVLANFINKQSERENLPELQGIGLERRMSARPVKTFNTGIRDANKPQPPGTSGSKNCWYCKSSHHINECESFMRIPRRERREFLRTQGLCYGCGSSQTHVSSICPNRVSCSICNKRHLTPMHIDWSSQHFCNRTGTIQPLNTLVYDNTMIVPVWLSSSIQPTNEILCYAILDGQSNSSFVSKEMCRRLNVQGVPTLLDLSTMTGRSRIIASERVRNLIVKGYDRAASFTVPQAYTRPEIPASINQIPRPSHACRWSHLRKLAKHLPSLMPSTPIGMLIGTNVPGAIRPRDVIAGGENEPYGQRSALGWGIVGCVEPATDDGSRVVSHRCFRTQEERNIQQFETSSKSKEIINPMQLRRWMESEFIEHKQNQVTAYSFNDTKFINTISENITKVENGHYEMPLPLKSTSVRMPDNKSLALKRLWQLKKRFERDPAFAGDYKEFMCDVIANCAEKVGPSAGSIERGWVNFIPHSGVYNPHKPGKIRVVFDCAAEYQGMCLNDVLLQGPDLLNNLVGILCRFRKETVALSVDIQGMYHQFYVNEKFRDFLRFLWWEENDPNKAVCEYRMKVHIFGAVSSPACANFGLRRAADDGEAEFGKDAADFIRQDFYVDDGVTSVENSDTAISLLNRCKGMCAKAGLKLHKLASNDQQVSMNVAPDERSKGMQIVSGQTNLHAERILGLRWCIENDARKFQTFVANRLQTIKENTNEHKWRYVKTEENPSDCASRGMKPEDLTMNSTWLRGPNFLWESSTNLQRCFVNHDPEVMKGIQLEMKKGVVLKTTAGFGVSDLGNRLVHVSTWHKAKRAVANCVAWKLKRRQDQNLKVGRSQLLDAERRIIRSIQHLYFLEEIQTLTFASERGNQRETSKRTKQKLKRQSSLYRLDPFLDNEGVLRVGGRLRNSNLTYDVGHPVIIPKNHHITNLIIRHCHNLVHHMGRSATHNCTRQQGYWIINGSSSVANYIRKCVLCRRLRGSLQTQKMVDLPCDRFNEEGPFSFSGMDYFGPFLVKEKRSLVKRYGVLFTCLSSRAIHIETANSLDTSSCINALRRFVARRGPVIQIRSDCGTNIVGTRNELQSCQPDQNEIQRFLLQHECDLVSFKFNVPHASHMGGVWERQIQTVKRVLAGLLLQNSSQLDDETFRTFITEVENVVNSRPLTIDAMSQSDSPEPLTPNHILTMKKRPLLSPGGVFQKTDLYLKKRWRRVQYLTDQFWTRWRKEFLQTLQVRKKWQGRQQNLDVGDVVLIHDDNAPRNQWKVGRVSVTYPSEDGMIRKVKLTVAEGDRDKQGKRTKAPSVLERPIHKLVLLVENDDSRTGSQTSS